MLSSPLRRRPTPLPGRVSVLSTTGEGRGHGGATTEARPRALLVDDSLTLQVTLKDALVAAGFAVVVCKSAAEARRALPHGPFSVIILDVMLPDASGVDLAHEIRTFGATARVPILLLSANAGIQQRVSGVASGADDFIGKACGPAYVVRRAREVCIARRAGDERAEKAGPYRILLIDDSPTFVDALAARMRLAGHDVVVANAGQQALDYLNVQQADVIVLDLLMPELSGLEICRRVKGTPALVDIPIVVVTGHDAPASTAGSLAGVDDFIRKSQGMVSILARLEKLLRHRRPGKAGGMGGQADSRRRGAAAPDSRPDSSPSRRLHSDPPPSAVRARVSFEPGEAVSSRCGPVSPLFEQVASVCGLSSFIARSSLKRALVRAGFHEATLSADDLARALPEIRWALSVFLPPSEIDERMASIQELAAGSPPDSWPKEP